MTMAMPAASAAAVTSGSFIEPPGWMTAVTPARMPSSSPSGNGKLERFVHKLGRDDDVRDDLHDLLCCVAVERPVHGDDAAERADLVAFVGHAVREADAVRDREPARVGVLDDRRGR